MLFDTWKLHKIQTSVSTSKVLLEHSHNHLLNIVYGRNQQHAVKGKMINPSDFMSHIYHLFQNHSTLLLKHKVSYRQYETS
jgi:hypothetical protein